MADSPASAAALLSVVNRVGAVWFAVAALFVVSGLISPAMFQVSQILKLLQVAAFLAVLATGQTLALLIGGIDLSQAGIVTLVNILSTSLMLGADANIAVAVIVSLAVAALVGLDPGSGAIRYAYPFTESATGHQVKLRGHSLHALCAIDALGVAGMYGADVQVRSPCRFCGATVHAATSDEGSALGSAAPAEALVWYDFAFSGSAATSCCTAIAFFCSDDHLRRWLDAQAPRREGIRLTMGEALEMGSAIVGPVLAEAKTPGGGR